MSVAGVTPISPRFGGVIGVDFVLSSTVRSGVFSLGEQFDAAAAGEWPFLPTFAMELVEPSSIAFAGTSAAIVGNGSVTFSAVTSLSLNGVFSSTYDNYMVVVRYSQTGGGGFDGPVFFRLRASGTDATAANYTHQLLEANDSSVSAARTSSATNGAMGRYEDDVYGGQCLFIYGPSITQPTAFRNLSGWGDLRISDSATTHSLSTVYDGLTIYLSGSGDITGRVAVYGLRG
jgi:hypothetical protein